MGRDFHYNAKAVRRMPAKTETSKLTWFFLGRYDPTFWDGDMMCTVGCWQPSNRLPISWE
jgi:hypothetical protein